MVCSHAHRLSLVEVRVQGIGHVPNPTRRFRALSDNWLQVLGTTELSQINQRVRHQLHAIVPLLDAFKS